MTHVSNTYPASHGFMIGVGEFVLHIKPQTHVSSLSEIIQELWGGFNLIIAVFELFYPIGPTTASLRRYQHISTWAAHWAQPTGQAGQMG